MRWNNIKYFILEGVRGIVAHGLSSVSSMAIITACLLLVGSFSLVAMNLDYNLQELMGKNEFNAYIDDSLTQQQAQALEGELVAIDHVAECRFVSREDAMKTFAEDLGSPDLFDSLPADMLRNRFTLRVDDLNYLEQTVAAARKVSGVARVTASFDLARDFVAMRNVCTVVAASLMSILTLVSMFIISNAVRLAAASRKTEIDIMKMVGASNEFIRAPFVIEGLIIGMLSGLISFELQCAFYGSLVRLIKSYTYSQLVSVLPYAMILPPLFLFYGCMGVSIGIIGSVFSIHRYLADR